MSRCEEVFLCLVLRVGRRSQLGKALERPLSLRLVFCFQGHGHLFRFAGVFGAPALETDGNFFLFDLLRIDFFEDGEALHSEGPFNERAAFHAVFIVRSLRVAQEALLQSVVLL